MNMKNFQHILLPFEIPKLKVVQNNEGRRFYVVPNGNSYPSITTVIDFWQREGIRKWRMRVGEEEAERVRLHTSKRGTKVHKMCDDYLNNKSEMLKGHNPEHVVLFEKLEEHFESVDKIHLQEEALFSNELRIAGRVDCIAEFNGKLSIIDFKTKGYPQKLEWMGKHFVQCAAYAEMWEERMKDMPIQQLVLMVTPEDGNAQIFTEDREIYKHSRIETLKNIIREFNNGSVPK